MTFTCLESHQKYRYLFFFYHGFFFLLLQRWGQFKQTDTHSWTCEPVLYLCPFSSGLWTNTRFLTQLIALCLLSSIFLSNSVLHSYLTTSHAVSLFPPWVYSCHWRNNKILKSKKGTSIIRHRTQKITVMLKNLLQTLSDSWRICGDVRTRTTVSLWILVIFTTQGYGQWTLGFYLGNRWLHVLQVQSASCDTLQRTH